MAKKGSQLQRQNDTIIGRLAWDDRSRQWVGDVEFLGCPVRLELDTGLMNPTPDEKLIGIGASREILEALAHAEPDWRSHAVKEIAKVLTEQQNIKFQQEEFAADLRLESIGFVLGSGGDLRYLSPSFLAHWKVRIRFTEDLAYWGSELSE